jgi:hypothetical protein
MLLTSTAIRGRLKEGKVIWNRGSDSISKNEMEVINQTRQAAIITQAFNILVQRNLFLWKQFDGCGVAATKRQICEFA